MKTTPLKAWKAAHTSLLCAAALIAVSPVATAQPPAAYPEKPIKWIVPYPPGGGLDAVTRAMSTDAVPMLGQPIVIENKTGAGGTIAAAFTAASVADGYTVMSIDSGSYMTAQHFYRKLSYSPAKDLRLVSTLVRLPVVLAVPSTSPFKTFQDLVAYAKANPGKLDYGSVGVGTPFHIGMEVLQARTDLKFQHAPYRAQAGIMTDLSTGVIGAALTDYGSAKPFLDGGRLRLLAVATEKRLARAPDVPTFEELGIKNLPVSVWHSVVAPAKTPDAVVARLAAVIRDAMNGPAAKAQMESSGGELFLRSGKEGESYVAGQAAFWEPIVKGMNIQLD